MQRHYLEVALSNAINENNSGNVKQLIKAIIKSSNTSHPDKANPTARDEQGRTFLHYALECGAYDAFDILFPFYQYDSELLLACDDNGRSLFWWAVARGKKNIAEKLLTYYKKKETATETTASSEEKTTEEATQLPTRLLPLARDTWLKNDNEGVTPLHWAAQSEDTTLLPWLIKNLNKQEIIIELINSLDKEFNTPLHRASQKKRREQIVFLLQLGADTDLHNNKVESFISYLEKDPSLLSIADLKSKIKHTILLQIHYQQLADPHNAALKSLYTQMYALSSLSDLVKHKINQDYEIDGLVDPITSSLLDISENPAIKKIYHHIYKDRLKLTTYNKKLLEHSDKLSKLDEDLYHDRVSRIISLNLLSWIGFAGSIVFLTCLLLAILTTTASLTGYIAGFAIGPILLISAAVLFTYDKYKRWQIVHGETYSLLTEGKEILEKLIAIEKNDLFALPVDTKTIRELEATISELDPSENQKRGIFFKMLIIGGVNNNNHKLIISELKKLSDSIEKIANEIIIKHKPITLMNATGLSPVVVSKLAIAPLIASTTQSDQTITEPPKPTQPASTAVPAATPSMTIIDIDEVLGALPRVSQLPQRFFAERDSSDEETELFMDQDQKKSAVLDG